MALKSTFQVVLATTALVSLSFLPSVQAGIVPHGAPGKISTCGKEWMPVNNITTNHGTIERIGFLPTMNKFCDAAHGQAIPPGKYLSMATRVWMNKGGHPNITGINGYVYYEIHNKQLYLSNNHTVDGQRCKEYLSNLARADRNAWYGMFCYGGTLHDDTRGGTWQVANPDVSYHAIAVEAPPKPEYIDKIALLAGPIYPLGNQFRGNTLYPFPVTSFDDIIPFPCHSHNDWESQTALYSALSVGCVSVEADIWKRFEEIAVQRRWHITKLYHHNTLLNLYVNPLKALLDKNGCVFPKYPQQPFTLLLNLKGDHIPELWTMLVKELQPLRDAGYLSTVQNGQFKQGPVTVVISGHNTLHDDNTAIPFPYDKYDKINPLGAIFFDARLDKDMANFNSTNAYYASAKYSRRGKEEEAKRKREEAHKKGFKVRYWKGPKNTGDWQKLVDAGVDRVSVDNLWKVAEILWNEDLL